jgi:hypothetical protein
VHPRVAGRLRRPDGRQLPALRENLGASLADRSGSWRTYLLLLVSLVLVGGSLHVGESSRSASRGFGVSSLISRCRSRSGRGCMSILLPGLVELVDVRPRIVRTRFEENEQAQLSAGDFVAGPWPVKCQVR